ncbi:MAG: zinc metalloprotease HtpX [Archaeoglobaceae archaeon]
MEWKTDRGLKYRMYLTWFLLAVIYLAFLTVLAALGFGYSVLIPIVAVFIFAQYYFSDKIVLMASKAKVVTESDAPELHAMIRGLTTRADLPMPRIAIMDTSVPNAFATGRNPEKAVVAVTTGLMSTLNRDEVEAVLAHELSHVKNRDVRTLTIASFLSTVAFFVMRWAMFAGMFGRRNGSFILILIVSVIVWLISFLLIRALSRYREYSADAGSAMITGKPVNLISALNKISGRMQRIGNDDKKSVEGMNAFFIIPAISKGSILSLFATHPPVEKRIERLQRMAY